jgi:hypothetical protein
MIHKNAHRASLLELDERLHHPERMRREVHYTPGYAEDGGVGEASDGQTKRAIGRFEAQAGGRRRPRPIQGPAKINPSLLPPCPPSSIGPHYARDGSIDFFISDSSSSSSSSSSYSLHLTPSQRGGDAGHSAHCYGQWD